MTPDAPSDAAEALYKRHGLNRCRDCDRPIRRWARFCEIDKSRRRAITFLRAAHREAEALGPRAMRAIHDAEVALVAHRSE